MPGRGETEQGRAIVYCIVPRDVAPRLHEALRRRFRDELAVEVIVEQRGSDRRHAQARRGDVDAAAPEDRRRIRAADGRRVAQRRAAVVPVAAPGELPRLARAIAERLVFVERVEPSTQYAEDIDTARLVTRIQAGERDLFAEVYMRFFDRMYSYLRVVLDDPHAAEDATQQVFMKALEALPRYERRSQPFRAWLFRIAHNHAVDEIGARKRLDLTEPATLEERREQPDLSALGWVSDRDFFFLIGRLPLAQRQVLTLRYMLDLTTAEISAVLDRAPDAVRMLQHRALRQLEERLTALGRRPVRSERYQPALVFRKAARVVRVRRYALSFQGPTG
jgi:RNA polymerase sigma-70 factor (ECF subfamily)